MDSFRPQRFLNSPGFYQGRLRDHHYGEGRYWDCITMGVLRDEFEALHGGPKEVAGE